MSFNYFQINGFYSQAGLCGIPGYSVILGFFQHPDPEISKNPIQGFFGISIQYCVLSLVTQFIDQNKLS